MKTLFKTTAKICALLFVMVSFSSCSSDNDSAPTKKELLAHKWYLVQQEYLNTTPSTVVVADECEQNTYFNFLDDGSLIAETFGLDMDSNCVSQSLVAATYDLTADGEKIYVTSGSPSMTQELTIESLTGSELIIFNSDLKIIFNR
ncbi:MAG: lipocalin family protein [Gelidibacter sp.]